eukprot:142640-Pyramimonas_sp.AAC.2
MTDPWPQPYLDVLEGCGERGDALAQELRVLVGEDSALQPLEVGSGGVGRLRQPLNSGHQVMVPHLGQHRQHLFYKSDRTRVSVSRSVVQKSDVK